MDETIRTGRIAHLAKRICGEELEDELSVLYAQTASMEISARLKSEVSDEDFVSAAAFIAASEIIKASSAFGGFKAGSISMNAPEAKNVHEASRDLRTHAELILMGKLRDDGFCFEEVGQ